jgi:hypothetical protein
MSNLETYLKAATRGLWGQKKLEVREELEAHVLEQARKLELQGFNHTDAIQKVLERIGPANIVSNGMIGVHTMPTMIRSAFAIFTLSITSALFATSGSKAQNLIFSFEADFFRSWLEMSNLQIKDSGSSIDVKFPDSDKVIQVKTFERKLQAENKTIRLISFSNFLESTARETQLPVQIQGWNPSVIQIGSSKLQLPDSDWIYNETLEPTLKSLGFNGLPTETGPACEHIVTVNDKTGMVYALMTTASLKVSESADGPQTRLNLYDLAPVGPDGTITFHIPTQTLEFTNDIKRITQPQRPIANEQALLIRLTGRFNPTFEYEPVMPTQKVTEGNKCRWF